MKLDQKSLYYFIRVNNIYGKTLDSNIIEVIHIMIIPYFNLIFSCAEVFISEDSYKSVILMEMLGLKSKIHLTPIMELELLMTVCF